MQSQDLLAAFEAAGILEPLDVELARALDRMAFEASPGLPGDTAREWVMLGAALASRAPRHGHICVDLRQVHRLPTKSPEGNEQSRDPTTESLSDDEETAPGEVVAQPQGSAEACWPAIDAWINALNTSPLVRVVDGNTATEVENTPLVLQQERLYLDRYWHYEQRLAAQVRSRVAEPAEDVDVSLLRDGILWLFPDPPAAKCARLPGVLGQRMAAMQAVSRRFLVLSGGPGTGKTSTVVNLLVLLLQQERARHPDVPLPRLARIMLVAPTGKAAARLSEAVREALSNPAWPADTSQSPGLLQRLEDTGHTCRGIDRELLGVLDLPATTIHRALGGRPDQPTKFRYSAENPLPADVVIVDEASMIDFALMTHLVEAIRPDARLILLGDKDQLASVEAGAVMGDLCDAGGMARGFSANLADRARTVLGLGTRAPDAESPAGEYQVPLSHDQPAMADAVAHLTYPFRFGADSGIMAFSRAILASGAMDQMQSGVARLKALDIICGRNKTQGERACKDLEWIGLDPDELPSRPRTAAGPACKQDTAVAGQDREKIPANTLLRTRVIDGFGTSLKGVVEAILASDDDTRDTRIIQALKAFGQFRVLCSNRRGPWGTIALNHHIRGWLKPQLPGDDTWFAGCPVMVLQNDYHVRLFNGDVGLVLPQPVTMTDGSTGMELRAVFPGADDQKLRLFPRSKLPAHEMCFAMTVHKSQGSQFDEILLVLPPTDSPFLTRELIYTGITRAKNVARVMANEDVLGQALARGVQRFSGLRAKVWA